VRLLALYGPVLVVLAVIALVVLRAWARRHADGDAASPLSWLAAISPIGALLGAAALVAGGVLLSLVSASLLGYVAARNWTATPCTILASTVESSTNSKGRVFTRLSVRYAYQAAGRRFEGTRYEFGPDASSGSDRAAQLAASLPAGMQVTCYVDPAEPDRSVVSREFSTELLEVGLPGLLFSGIGVVMLVGTVRGARASLRAESA
jgi:hypothetical protein